MCESNTPYGTGVREGSWLYRFLLTQWMCAYWCICFGENNPKLTWLLQKEHNFYAVLRKLKLYTSIIHTNLSSIHHHQSIFYAEIYTCDGVLKASVVEPWALSWSTLEWHLHRNSFNTWMTSYSTVSQESTNLQTNVAWLPPPLPLSKSLRW